MNELVNTSTVPRVVMRATAVYLHRRSFTQCLISNQSVVVVVVYLVRRAPQLSSATPIATSDPTLQFSIFDFSRRRHGVLMMLAQANDDYRTMRTAICSSSRLALTVRYDTSTESITLIESINHNCFTRLISIGSRDDSTQRGFADGSNA